MYPSHCVCACETHVFPRIPEMIKLMERPCCSNAGSLKRHHLEPTYFKEEIKFRSWIRWLRNRMWVVNSVNQANQLLQSTHHSSPRYSVEAVPPEGRLRPCPHWTRSSLPNQSREKRLLVSESEQTDFLSNFQPVKVNGIDSPLQIEIHFIALD